jgi:hypothetical protein
MNKAVKVRKVKQGTGTIYKLDPPYEHMDKQWDFAIAKSYKSEVLYGFVGLPAASMLFLSNANETGGFAYGPKLLDIHNTTISEASLLKRIGYSVKTS